MRGEEIRSRLCHRHRLSLVFFDCCNRGATVAKSHSFKPIISTKLVLPGLRSLFLDAKGSITVSAVSQNEIAFCLNKQKPFGGYFTTGLLHALIKICKKKTCASWNDVLSEARIYVVEVSDGKQHPFFTVE
jgi:hypothetical protein